MVDYAQYSGNFTGTVVTNNTIDASGAQIVVAISMGPRIWSSWCGQNLTLLAATAPFRTTFFLSLITCTTKLLLLMSIPT